jgi:vacuolar-type H+-ATPase subunit I/STV1
MSYPGKITIEEQGKVRRLKIHDVNFDHEGTYACDCKEDKTSSKLAVAQRAVRFVKELQSVEVNENEEAVFEVELNVEDVDVTWYHKGVPIPKSDIYEQECLGKKHRLSIANVNMEDLGEIRVQAEQSRSVAQMQVCSGPTVFLSEIVDTGAMVDTEVVTFECETSQEVKEQQFTWVVNGEVIDLSTEEKREEQKEKFNVVTEGKKQILQVFRVNSDDNLMKVEAKLDNGQESEAVLRVAERDVQMLAELKDREVDEGGSTTYNIELNFDDVEVEWYVNGNRI